MTAAFLHLVGTTLRRRPPTPTCSGCRELARQLAAARLHIAGLERANDSYRDANLVLAGKVARLEGRRRVS